mmetsp:Transcript_7696/g.26505  ORF Transcript_7696/g.26505 Transcript_7696/m.26505 type:complete len:458 (+) Transcript_7696:35-1408(+)
MALQGRGPSRRSLSFSPRPPPPPFSSVVVQAGLLLRPDLDDALVEVLVVHLRGVPPEREHASLHAYGLELRAVEVLGAPAQLVKVDVRVDVHLPGVDLQDSRAGLLVRVGELDLAVQSATPHQRGVQDVGPVGGGDDLDLCVGGESVQLVQELQHRSLHLPVPGELRVEPLGPDRIDLVDKYDTRGLLLREGKGVSHELGAVSDEHLHELGSRELQKGGVGLGGAGPSDQGLPRPGGAVEQDSLGGPDSQVLKVLLVRHGQHDGLHQLPDLLVQASDVRVVLRGLLVHLHHLDPRVVLGRQGVQHQVAVLVHADEVARLEGLRVDQAHDRQEDRLPRAGLEHDALPRPLGVEVRARPVLLLVLRSRVKDLHDVPHQVRQLLVELDLFLVVLDLLLGRAQVQRKPCALVLQHPDLVLQQTSPSADLVRGHPQYLLVDLLDVVENLLLQIRRGHGDDSY